MAVPTTQLGGVEAEMVVKKVAALSGDFVHVESGVFAVVDESQDFLVQAATLDLYPDGTQLGFDLTEYKNLCRKWAPTLDRYRRDKAAVGFGPRGRQRQHAYNDGLRDLVTPATAHPHQSSVLLHRTGTVRGVRESPRPPANSCGRPETRAVWSGPVPVGRIQPQPDTVTAAALPTLRWATTEEGSASAEQKTTLVLHRP